jgi:hypothetical protein
LQESEKNDASENRLNEIQSWLNLALSIDAAARVLIDVSLRQAASEAKDEKTTAWIEKSTEISDGEYDDLSIIVELIEESEESHSTEEFREQKRRKLSSRIEKLDMFRTAILIMERGYWVSAICQFVNNCQSLFV